MEIFFYILIGTGAGLLAGLLGVGGGLVIVPSLVSLFEVQAYPIDEIMRFAAGTSFAAMLLTTLTSSYTYIKKKLILFNLIKQIMPAMLVGVIWGSHLVYFFNNTTLKILFSLVLLGVAVNLWFSHVHDEKNDYQIAPLILMVSTVGIGIISGLFGISGGALLIPFLVHHKIPIRNALATASLSNLAGSITGTVFYMMNHPKNMLINDFIVGYVNWVAAICIGVSAIAFVRIGVKFAMSWPKDTIKKLFVIFLICTSLKMMLF